MTRALELTLGGLFTKTVGIYIQSFPRAYKVYHKIASEEDVIEKITPDLKKYCDVIKENRDEIFRAAAAEINKYLSYYAVHANQSADEFKLIYFLGIAAERHFAKAFPDLAQIHMLIMIGLLDYKLATLGIFKPKLTMALARLIAKNKFKDELGANGCYLTYKCVATVAIASNSTPSRAPSDTI